MGFAVEALAYPNCVPQTIFYVLFLPFLFSTDRNHYFYEVGRKPAQSLPNLFISIYQTMFTTN